MNHFGFEYWLFTFCVYCILGWMQESAIESIYHKKPINRGFLKGPYIPIYGVGGLFLLFICAPFRDNPAAVFFIALLFCTVLEYFTGWAMETLFGKQFWDYSMLKLVYKNRISLVTSLFWGVMGLFVTYIVSDATVFVLSHLPYQLICVSAVLLSLIMTIDFVNTCRKELCKKGHMFSFSGGYAIRNVTGRIKGMLSIYNRKSDKEDIDDD